MEPLESNSQSVQCEEFGEDEMDELEEEEGSEPLLDGSSESEQGSSSEEEIDTL